MKTSTSYRGRKLKVMAEATKRQPHPWCMSSKKKSKLAIKCRAWDRGLSSGRWRKMSSRILVDDLSCKSRCRRTSQPWTCPTKPKYDQVSLQMRQSVVEHADITTTRWGRKCSMTSTREKNGRLNSWKMCVTTRVENVQIFQALSCQADRNREDWKQSCCDGLRRSVHWAESTSWSPPEWQRIPYTSHLCIHVSISLWTLVHVSLHFLSFETNFMDPFSCRVEHHSVCWKKRLSAFTMQLSRLLWIINENQCRTSSCRKPSKSCVHIVHMDATHGRMCLCDNHWDALEE